MQFWAGRCRDKAGLEPELALVVVYKVASMNLSPSGLSELFMMQQMIA